METIRRSRRTFLRQIVYLLAGIGLLVRYLIPTREVAGEILRVPLVEIPSRGALVYQQSRVALVREAGGVVALSLACTHLGCTLNVTPDELVCPCHGSRFDHTGRVIEGPASRSLKRFVVNSIDNQLEVQLGPGRPV